MTPTVLLLHAFPLDGAMWGRQDDVVRVAGLDAVAPRLYRRGASIDEWGRLFSPGEGRRLAALAPDGRFEPFAGRDACSRSSSPTGSTTCLAR